VNVFERMAAHGHEQVVFCYDRESGMRAIIAMHSTAMGPARGGTRYAAYDNEDDALDDALRLAQGMTYKFAWTDMPRGGAKAVLLAGDPTDKPVHLRIYGRHVQLLAGRFGTGPDYGTTSADMAEIARETEYVWGANEAFGGTGDSSPLTAQGTVAGICAALEHVFGSAELHGRTAAVQGLGGVGSRIAELLVSGGANVVAADPDADRAGPLADRLGLQLVDPDAIYDQPCDVFSPNARGGVINRDTIPRLRCRIVAGGANNQLGSAEDGARLHERSILYAPDYVINSAGAYVIAGRGELGYSDEHLRQAAASIGPALKLIFRRATTEGRPTAEIADRIAEERIAAAARSRALACGSAVAGSNGA
jgi:glutamate dehydrogenase/leucine dehydrogenase